MKHSKYSFIVTLAILSTILVVTSFAVPSCNKGNKFIIQGKVSDALANTDGAIAILMLSNPQQTDSAKIENGSFRFEGIADQTAFATLFISTPDNPEPDYLTDEILPKYFLPIVTEKGIIEVFIGDTVEVLKGKISKDYLDLQRKLIDIQLEAQKYFDERPQIAQGEDMEKAKQFSDSCHNLSTDICKEYYEKHSDNAIGVATFAMMVFDLSDEEIQKYWDMASPDVKKQEEVRQYLELTLAERGFELEGDKIVTKKEGNTTIGEKFVDFTATTPDGGKAKLSDYVGKGKYVLVDFWAYWCGPCLVEMPTIAAIYNDFKGENFELVSVSVDQKLDATISAIKEQKMVWPQLIVDDFDVINKDYGIATIPYTILFSPNGTILEKNLRGEQIREALKKYLN